jgi:hypothetical protein
MAIAGVLYVLLLANALGSPESGGEARIAQAYAALLLTAGLWTVLALMLLVGGATGAIPGWAAALAFVLLPLSGAAAFAAMDMCSRGIKAAAVFPALLPLIVAAYAYWARSTRLHARWPARRASFAAWGTVLALSLAALILAAV